MLRGPAACQTPVTRRSGQRRHDRILVLGLGNTLLGDDGVGVHAVRDLQRDGVGHRGVTLLDGGTLSFTLDTEIEQTSHLIVIDAAQLNRAPGEVQVFEGGRMDAFVGRSKKSSVHEVSLVDLLAMATLGGHLPQWRALIGIQPLQIHWSGELSDPVQQALAPACGAAREIVKKWRTLEETSPLGRTGTTS